MQRLLYLLCAVCSFTTMQAQSIFEDVSAVQFGDSILIDWKLTGGNTCYDMYLQRSHDATGFETIFTVSGVCGGSDDQYYNFIDSENLITGTVYSYQVTASGGLFKSEPATITYINAGDVQIFVYPNPTQTDITITIDNSYKPQFFVELYSYTGQLISKALQYENLFTLSIEELVANPYLIKITTEDGMVFGQKIIVQ